MKNWRPPRPERKTLRVRGKGLAPQTRAERTLQTGNVGFGGSLNLTGREANAEFKVWSGESRRSRRSTDWNRRFAELRLMSGDTRQLGSGRRLCWGFTVCQLAVAVSALFTTHWLMQAWRKEASARWRPACVLWMCYFTKDLKHIS